MIAKGQSEQRRFIAWDVFKMGFGSGLSGEGFADAIDARERRLAREEIRDNEIVEHLVWFEDYESAKRWEDKHRGKSFLRRKLQGGFEVAIKARRGDRFSLRNNEVPDRRDKEPELLLLSDLAEHEITHGTCSVRLAKRCETLVSEQYRYLLSRTPAGRILLSPTYISTTNLEASIAGMRQPLAYSIDLPNGIVAMFADDHSMIVGRKDGRDIRLWPWVLVLQCDEMSSDTPRPGHCILCDHFADREDFIMFHRYDKNPDGLDEPIFPHSISKKVLDDARRTADLSQCLSEWITLLQVYDTDLNDGFQAPVTGAMTMRNQAKDIAKMSDWCSILSQLIAARERDECDVTVAFETTNQSLPFPQIAPGDMKFVYRKKRSVQGSVTVSKSFARSKIKSEDSFSGPIPTWSDMFCVTIPVSGNRPPSDMFDKTIGKGQYTTKGLSSHQKMAVLQSALEMLGDNIPSSVKTFLDDAYKAEIEDQPLPGFKGWKAMPPAV